MDCHDEKLPNYFIVADRAICPRTGAAVKESTMKLSKLFMVLLFAPLAVSAQEWKERADWAKVFADAGAVGTIAVIDERMKDYFVHDSERWKVSVEP
jgi:hypothetical protein